MSSELIGSLTSEVFKRLLRNSLSDNFGDALFLFRGAEKSQKQKLEMVTKWYREQTLVMVLGAGQQGRRTLTQTLRSVVKTDQFS